MEKINQHIEKLLAYHDYVVVPGLGGFVVQHQSAEIHHDSITAPHAAIGFNPLMLHSDGLLAIEVARAEEVSYRQAMEMIAEEIDSLKARISSDKSLKFGNLGHLILNDDNSVTFQPFVQASFLSQNLGLPNLKVSPLKNQLKIPKKHINFVLPKARSFKYAAAAVLILGMLTISTQVNDTRKYNYAEMLTLPEMTLKSIEADIKQNESLELVANLTENDKTIVETKSPYQFHVVVASLGTEKAAESYCKVLLDDNFTEAHILSSAKLYKVILQSFEEKEVAIRFMQNLRKTDNRFETAWVMCE